MNVITLILVGLIGTVCSSVPSRCKPDCKERTECRELEFKHVSELQHSSVAPWNLSVDTQVGREPTFIHYAQCLGCTVEHMTAEPIFFQVSVYEMIRSSNGTACCECPFKLAVGCTCVSKQ